MYFFKILSQILLKSDNYNFFFDFENWHELVKFTHANISHTSCILNIFWIENILIKSGIFNLSGKKYLTKNKGTNNNLLAIDATETPIERIKKN